MAFLPIEPNEIVGQLDFVYVIPEAYVDHPSFGHAIISRLIESEGFSIGLICQPKKDEDYKKFGKPSIAFLISGGVVDSMVNNYTVAKVKRDKDEYSEGGRAGNRPDRAVTVYSKNLKRLFPDIPVLIGGIEPSLRRFAHYDYWSDSVMPSILVDSKADLLIYGMGERPFLEILNLLRRNVPIRSIKNIDGTCYLTSFNELTEKEKESFNRDYIFCPSLEEIKESKMAFYKAYKVQYENANYISGKALAQKHRNQYVICNQPQKPLTVEEMDRVYNLPYMGTFHPSYKDGVPAIEEVKFSITSHRGCFGSCSYCALTFHQGRVISKRSKGNIVSEAIKLTEKDDFKGYIHDIGGATANFRNKSCEKQDKYGVCKNKLCIGDKPCEMLKIDHTEYLDILRTVRKLPKIKKVFIRSGIRFDYVMYDKNTEFFEELVEHHVSGQLKVAPEHNSDKVLKTMNKPNFQIYKEFSSKFSAYTKKINKEQYLVPYLISSHPGAEIDDALRLTEYLISIGYMPEQVQDFYPTPATWSTCMYYTGLDKEGKEIYVPKTKEEKKLQRALLQYRKPENKAIIKDILSKLNYKPKIGVFPNVEKVLEISSKKVYNKYNTNNPNSAVIKVNSDKNKNRKKR